MRKSAFVAAILMATTLTACGSDAPEYGVVEKIVVRERGEAAVPAPAAAEPVDLVQAGERVFATCTGCHASEKGEPSSAGPNLYEVFGQAAGAREDFAYSEALAASGLTWDAENLDRFMADPSGTVPGTYMAAGAVTDAEQRSALIAYLETLGD